MLSLYLMIAVCVYFLPRDAYSAQRGMAIACRPSVCLSVRLSVTLVDQDHVHWKSRKQWHGHLAQHLFSSEPKGHPPTPRGTRGNFWETRGGVEKMAFWSTKAAICLKRIKIQTKLLWEAYRNSPSLFRTVPFPTPYGLPFPKIGVSTPPKIPIAVISGTGKATNFKFGHNNNRVHPIKSP